MTSALTLCLSREERNEVGWKAFYIRRYFRIAPMYYFGIVLYAGLAILLHLSHTGQFYVPDRYYPVFLIENITFTNIFDYRHFNDVVPGGWSISVEFMLYFLFPFGLVMIGKTKRLHVAYRAALIFLTVFIFYLANNFVKAKLNNAYSYGYDRWFGQSEILILSLIPFFIGIVAYQEINNNNSIFGLRLIGALGVLLSIFLLNTEALIPFKSFYTVTTASVGFYCYVILFDALNLYKVASEDGALAIVFIFALIITYGVSVVTYNVIERRFMRLGSKLFLHQ